MSLTNCKDSSWSSLYAFKTTPFLHPHLQNVIYSFFQYRSFAPLLYIVFHISDQAHILCLWKIAIDPYCGRSTNMERALECFRDLVIAAFLLKLFLGDRAHVQQFFEGSYPFDISVVSFDISWADCSRWICRHLIWLSIRVLHPITMLTIRSLSIFLNFKVAGVKTSVFLCTFLESDWESVISFFFLQLRSLYRQQFRAQASILFRSLLLQSSSRSFLS